MCIVVVVVVVGGGGGGVVVAVVAVVAAVVAAVAAVVVLVSETEIPGTPATNDILHETLLRTSICFTTQCTSIEPTLERVKPWYWEPSPSMLYCDI